MSHISLADIEAARLRIAGDIRATPMVTSPALEAVAGVPVWLKLEHLQDTGSFKLRGATHAIKRLDASARAKGVVAASTGNHGRGLARAASRAGVACTICMSSLVPDNKVDAIRELGATIRIIGKSQDDAQVEVDRLVAEQGMTMLPPFDHPDIIAGQGTLGLEMHEAVPDMATVLVQVSGGGLISGVAAALKAQRPDIRVIGISMRRGAAMHACLAAGKPVFVEEEPTLADSLGGGIGLDNRYTFAMVRDLVDDVILLEEDEIARGIHHCYWHEGQIVEGSGAVGVAALLARKVTSPGPVVALLSGGNIAMDLHHRIISGASAEQAMKA